MRSVGLCVGASNISVAVIDFDDESWRVVEAFSQPHEGKTREKFLALWGRYASVDFKAVTGRTFKDGVNGLSVSEPEAVEVAYQQLRELYGSVDTIVSAGGEIFAAYKLSKGGQIANVFTGNKCASGTGEFFLQQIKRMNLNLDEAVRQADQENPYPVSGRCSVFCKSDCTHALNKGTPRSQVVAGLSLMMARKVWELVTQCDAKRVMLVGGASQNEVMVSDLQQRIEVIVPREAKYFEALGAALWARHQRALPLAAPQDILRDRKRSFPTLPPLSAYSHQVTWHHANNGEARLGDRCILGLDVGSTTTKAVLIRKEDQAVVASVYLRTNGDPVGASRECYRKLQTELGAKVSIIGLGVTGSGRQIAGLHALTPAVINEIVAHATGAVYFDADVDTILEIGGQDAKYTLINNRVPVDYAMNEACSAGTGSFLEEAAGESLEIAATEIGGWALRGSEPPNFNDQCAAFISSDIKVAIHEDISIADICAGLVYSVCQNYNNRVRGARTVGRKVFMQGGVCYNRAVPIAMSVLLGKEIVVPPQPGLMGAFGVALEVSYRQDAQLLPEQLFDLQELIDREVVWRGNFTCNGGKEQCDRSCLIARYDVAGQVYPFGGACNRYANLMKQVDYPVAELNRVVWREKTTSIPAPQVQKSKDKMAIHTALTNYSFYPLFASFFGELGWEVVTPSAVVPQGIEEKGAAFCYPVEISHGMMADLLSQDWDYLWLPQIRRVQNPQHKDGASGVVCPLAQGEPYYLRAAFPQLLKEKVLSPVLDFTVDGTQVRRSMVAAALSLGVAKEQAIAAWENAVRRYAEMNSLIRQDGERLLARLAHDSQGLAIVLFGRPYNAFTGMANMGIPHKFASRGYPVVPYDHLPFGEHDPDEDMYWTHGQMIMQAANYVKRDPRLYGVFITNFSCGPDSFLLSYFRHEMGLKPSLTLELDNHSADAGIDTRIEAFLDIVDSYRKTNPQPRPIKTNNAARVIQQRNRLLVEDSQGTSHRLTDKRVHVLVPNMGDFASRLLAASLRHVGVNASSCPPPGERELQLGRAHSSCKECLPLQLCMGSLFAHFDSREDDQEVLVYFMPKTSGPCRFGQYNVLIKQMLETSQIENVALLSLTSENGYAGLGNRFALRVWAAVIIADAMDDIHNALITLAVDREQALTMYRDVERAVLSAVETRSISGVKRVLSEAARHLRDIPLTASLAETPSVFVTGEIYVRRDEFARQRLVEQLADQGIIAKVAPNSEWLYYVDYVHQHGLLGNGQRAPVGLGHRVANHLKRVYERDIKRILSQSGLTQQTTTDIDHYVEYGSNLMSPLLTGEAILTVGGTFAEIVDEVDGVLALAPFGCMPNRIAEAIIHKTLHQRKRRLTKDPSRVNAVLDTQAALPFLSIETDGNVLPPVVKARFETFCLQVKRLRQRMKDLNSS